MNFEILTEENFMGIGTASFLSDFAIACGVKPYYDFSNKRTVRLAFGSYFLDNPLLTKDLFGRYNVVNYKGYISKEYCLGQAYGVKPMVCFDDIKDLSSNFKNKNGYTSFEYGTYPQRIVGKADKFISNLDKNKLIRTEKVYHFYSDLEEKVIPLYEYDYNGRKYVFLKANLKIRKNTVSYEDGIPFEYIICNGSELFSDGNTYVNGEDVVFEVTPVKWILNEKTNKAFTKSILLGNIPINLINNFLKNDFVI